MAKTILLKPLVSEKAERNSEKMNRYTFIVHKKANKIEIKNAVEEMYGVTVDSVSTAIMPAKRRNRNTRTAVIKGRVSAYKKAVVRVTDGDYINFYGDI